MLPNFDNDSNDVLTASDNSMGNSGGTTDVKISAHSRNSLYLFLVGSSEPVINNTSIILISCSFTIVISFNISFNNKVKSYKSEPMQQSTKFGLTRVQ